MPRQMFHQPKKPGQLAGVHALFEQRQDVLGVRGPQEEIAILDALGDAVEGDQVTDGEIAEKPGDVGVGDSGVNGQSIAPF
jgi:hypothetical protein